jgi:hypothetical protein
VQSFVIEPTIKSFNGAFNAPLDEKHVIVIDVDTHGSPLYGKVINDAKYINHSCDPNCEVKLNSENIREAITTKLVNKDEELTIGYDIAIPSFKNNMWDPRWNFECYCGTKVCRKIIDSYKTLK